ncbi:hypothetical protein EDB89DRAFT_743725 [Lactarius sanguifluus]|nr:hypothetical protein EDB89DRAFT_743725 [Lactarius sanguifluus]
MSSHKVVLKDRSSRFDKLSFAKYMKNIGRAYRKQAMELVSICRTFVQAGERSVSQDADLKQVLEVTDDALSSAADAKSKTSETADTKLEEAINALSNYEEKYHPKQQDATNGQQDITNGKQNATERPLVAERMKCAQENDKSSSKVLNRLNQSFKAKLVEGPTKVARFLLPGSSLPDTHPKVVEQMLGEETSVQEILWNFSRLEGKKRITLKQNPHFYKGLPNSAREYNDEFTSDPIVKFWDATDEIWVLTDERSRVYLETEKRTRAFGNFWVPDEAIIFKEIGGRLEGERIVAEDIGGTPNLWHREEPAVIPPPIRRPAGLAANPSDLPPIDTNPVRGKTFEDWRQLVRGTLNSPNISLRISTKGTPPESEDDWVRSSPTNTTPDSPTQSFSIMQEGSTVTSSGAIAPQLPALQIPEPSLGPHTAQSYKSAWSTFSPVYRTPLTEIPPSFTPPSTPDTRKTSAAAPPSPAKLTPISQDSAVAVLSSLSLTMTTLTPPQARPLPGLVPQRPELPPQKPALAGLISSRALTPGGGVSSPQSTTLSSSTNDLARPSGLHAGDSQVANRTSMTVSVPVTTTKDQATSPGQQQARGAAAPVKGPAQAQKKKNWFQKFIWDYDTGK